MAGNPTFRVTKRIAIVAKLPARGERIQVGIGYEAVLITSQLGPGQIRLLLLVTCYSAASMAHYDGYGAMP
jgi:hypothetical protein